MTSPVEKGDRMHPALESDDEHGHPADDEDEGGRTIASIPEFEIPHDMPSPLGSVPPPAGAAGRAAPAAARPAAPAAAPAAATRVAPRPATAMMPPRPGPASAASPPRPGPGSAPRPGLARPITAPMAGGPPSSNRAAASPASPASSAMQTPRMPPVENPHDVETAERPVEDAPTVSATPAALDAMRGTAEAPGVIPEEESTRTLSREEMFGQPAAAPAVQLPPSRMYDQIVVGDDAIGDEATLAAAPGQLDIESIRRAAQRFDASASAGNGSPGARPEGRGSTGPSASEGIGLALAEALAQPDSNRHLPPPTFDPPASWAHPHPQAHAQQQQTAGMMAPPMMAPYAGSPGSPGGYGPQGGPQAWPGAQTPPGYGAIGGAPPNASNQGPAGALPMAHAGNGRSTGSTQYLVIAIVGGVCLAIFVTGLYLFLTTKF